MERNITINTIEKEAVIDREIEIVERKGIGHPDTVADGIAETVSRELSKMYLERYDRILHHNTDQVEIVGGQSKPKFGGGAVLEPVYILLSGRAVTKINDERVPYRSVAVQATKNYLRDNFPNLDIDPDVMIDCRIGQGSVDLRGVYDTQRELANDTSFGVGFAPLSETERLDYNTEKYINGDLKKKLPEIGEDVKVMAFRQKDNINLTIAAAFVDSKTPDKDHYINVKEELKNHILDNSTKYTDKNVNVFINTADIMQDNVYYLTVTGLSMENGDDGSVGRGNRANGLITPYRPMSLEASAGKNPVTHVGKLYNVLATKIAEDIAKNAGGDLKEVNVRIVSQIGKRIDLPHVADIQVIPYSNVNIERYKPEFLSIANEWFENISKITEMIINNEITVF